MLPQWEMLVVKQSKINITNYYVFLHLPREILNNSLFD